MKHCRFWVLMVFAFLMSAGAVGADVFFVAVDSGYSNASIGIVSKTGEEYKVFHRLNRAMPTGFMGDSFAFAFQSPAGEERLLLREYDYTDNDSVYIYDLKNWDKPLYNAKWGVKNIVDAVSIGQYLYVIAQDSGSIIKVGVNSYSVVGSYQFQPVNGLPRRPVRIAAYNNSIYVVSNSTVDFLSWGISEVHKFDTDLKPVGAPVEIGVNVGGMSATAALYGNNFYVACLGDNVAENGSFWRVDLNDMTREKLIDLSSHPSFSSYTNPMASGVSIAADGTALLLIADSYAPTDVYLASVTTLNNKEIGTATDFTLKTGWSFGATYDKDNDIFWLMNGVNLEARGKNGALLKVFTPIDLADEQIYTIAAIGGYQDGGDIGSGNRGGGGGGGCNTVMGLLACLLVIQAGFSRTRKI